MVVEFSFGIITENKILDCTALWIVSEIEWNLLVSSMFDFCSSVSRLISWERYLPVVTAE